MTSNMKKEKALAMRKQGKSINDIAKEQSISKSTASIWCRNINLSEKQKKILYKKGEVGRKRGRLVGAKINKEKKLSRVNFFKKLALNEIKKISKRDLELITAALYWAEGAKTESRFMFVNSDPNMIMIVYLYLTNVLKIPLDRIKPVVQVNEVHRYRVDKILKFWSDLLGLPISSFGNTYYIKTSHNKIYDNHDSYYGILRLRVSRGSDYQYKVLGIIDAIICRGSSGG